MKSKTTTVILAFFIGGLGIHRFYLGQYGQGILYLLFCWTFIPSLIAIIDFIGFLIMSDETFNQKYNPNSIIMKSLQTQSPVNAMNTVAINMGNANSSDKSNSEEIKKFFELKEKGIITQEEFELKKKTLL
jgi:TM2 domain-containing membrane protein YozV